MTTSKSYHSYLIESLKDPQAAYLEVVFEDGGFEEMRLALTNVVEAQILVLDDAKSVLRRREIYEALTQQNQLDFSALLAILSELGFKVSVVLKKNAA